MYVSGVKKILYRKQFAIVFCILFGSIIVDYIISCISVYGQDLSAIPSAYDVIIIDSYFGAPLGLLFNSFIFFLVSSSLASDLFYDEKTSGITSMIFTREDKSKYIWKIASLIAITNFFVIVFVLIIHQLLVMVAFPLQGHGMDDIAFRYLCTPDNTRILSTIEYSSPYLNNLIFIVIRGLISAATAIFAMSLSLFSNINKYVFLLVPMFMYIVYTLVISLVISLIDDLTGDIRLCEIIGTDVLNVNGYGSIVITFIYILALASGLVIIKAKIRDENGIIY